MSNPLASPQVQKLQACATMPSLRSDEDWTQGFDMLGKENSTNWTTATATKMELYRMKFMQWIKILTSYERCVFPPYL